MRILNPNRWRQTAQIEPEEYFRLSILGMWRWEAIIAAVLGAMAYWDVPVKWMIPIATILVIHEICGSIRESTYRLEGVRQLLENQSRE